MKNNELGWKHSSLRYQKCRDGCRNYYHHKWSTRLTMSGEIVIVVYQYIFATDEYDPFNINIVNSDSNITAF